MQETVALFQKQSLDLDRIGRLTAATFNATKTMSEGSADIPTLVTIKLKDAPEWKGAWHDRVGSKEVRCTAVSWHVQTLEVQIAGTWMLLPFGTNIL